MSYKLFLDDQADDVRKPSETVENPRWRLRMGLPMQIPAGHALGPRWAIARNLAEARAYIDTLGFPEFVSFDHDLGGDETGLMFARYLIDLDIDDQSMPDNFSFEVHSANPIGRENIAALLERYLQSRQNN